MPAILAIQAAALVAIALFFWGLYVAPLARELKLAYVSVVFAGWSLNLITIYLDM